MTEVYKNTSQEATLVINGAEADDVPTATCFFGNEPHLLEVTGPVVEEGREIWTTNISIEHTQEETTFSLVWNFSISGIEATKTDYFDVVTPHVSISQVREELELPASVTDEKIVRVERKVRRIIERACGQKFGLRRETQLVRGNGRSEIRLPAKLHSIEDVTRDGVTLTSNFDIRNDGIFLKRGVLVNEPVITGAVPIERPRREFVFPAGRDYVIDGYWGWDRVPQAVQEAALILIEQELCPESVYRERYIDNVASADFRFNLNGQAFHGTGNATADALLQDYVWQGAVVL